MAWIKVTHPLVWLAVIVRKSLAHDCTEEVDKTPTVAEPDWLESEVIAGFRVWQILFLICAGIGTLIVVACCFTRCRIPRTRQEIEANHRRSQITLMFRAYLDRMVVDEIDLMWALDEVKAAAEKRNNKKRKRKKTSEEEENRSNQSVNSNLEGGDAENSDFDELPKKMTFTERIRRFFRKENPESFSDVESNQLSSNLDNYSL
ncbi:transmembrane inner ear expressed protein-like [Uloborus diversus]|uniref:transmembrane inner ear expressed protein-like n=1 Tax=Uloborus diversus TaxID=327109 RepID=UPI00240A2928|nr:transmembrane inner ear expressed protein-like [Uloborus diversus]